MIDPASIALKLVTWKTRFLVGGSILLALCGVRACDINNQRSIGAKVVLKESKEEGAKANAKNENIRADAQRPGAADRVRKKYCGDC
jgi:hypothetical protein